MIAKRADHPLTERIDGYAGGKILVRMPDGRLRWRMPRWRLGSWYVRDSHGWRELIKKVGGGFKADTM